MKRFFMTKSDAINLILNATTIAKGGETFILKMPLLKLEDLFDAMKIVLGPKYGFKPSQLKTKVTGIRPGEKLTEYLLTHFEMENCLETKDFFIIPKMFESINSKKYRGSKTSMKTKKYFENQKSLTKQEIVKLLKKIY